MRPESSVLMTGASALRTKFGYVGHMWYQSVPFPSLSSHTSSKLITSNLPLRSSSPIATALSWAYAFDVTGSDGNEKYGDRICVLNVRMRTELPTGSCCGSEPHTPSVGL